MTITECFSAKHLKKAFVYLLSLVPGSIVIYVLVYFYVFRQGDLITHRAFFALLVALGVSLSLLFSLLESALMTINALQHVSLLKVRTTELSAKFPMHDEASASDEYIEERHALDAEKLLVSKASERNAPIVVLNHLSTVLLGAILPISLNVLDRPVIKIDLCSQFAWLEYPKCPVTILGTGSESLTFFSVSLLLIVFGKIVPEKIGRKHNAWIIRNFRGQIDAMSVVVGWLVKPILALGDLVLLIF
jgi:CBS domain containing-hemolysin-like protein